MLFGEHKTVFDEHKTLCGKHKTVFGKHCAAFAEHSIMRAHQHFMLAYQIVRGDHPKIVTTKQRELLDDQAKFMKRSGTCTVGSAYNFKYRVVQHLLKRGLILFNPLVFVYRTKLLFFRK